MKILFDQNISFKLLRKISDIFPLAKQVRLLGIENSTDREIWEYAKINEYAIVTFDGDFYDFSLVWGHPPKVIWLRTGNKTTLELEILLRKHLSIIGDFLKDEELTCLEIYS